MHRILICILSFICLSGAANAAIVTITIKGTSLNTIQAQSSNNSLFFDDHAGNFEITLTHNTESGIFYEGSSRFNQGRVITEAEFLALRPNSRSFYRLAGQPIEVTGRYFGEDGPTFASTFIPGMSDNLRDYNAQFSFNALGQFEMDSDSLAISGGVQGPNTQRGSTSQSFSLSGILASGQPLTFDEVFNLRLTQFFTTSVSGFEFTSVTEQSITISDVPLPAAVWFFGVGLIALRAKTRKRTG